MRNIPSKQIFLALLRTNRPDGEEINEEEIADDARNLYEKHLTWIELLSNRRLFLFEEIPRRCSSNFDRSNEQLKRIFDVYERYSGVEIEEALKNDGTLTAIGK